MKGWWNFRTSKTTWLHLIRFLTECCRQLTRMQSTNHLTRLKERGWRKIELVLSYPMLSLRSESKFNKTHHVLIWRSSDSLKAKILATSGPQIPIRTSSKLVPIRLIISRCLDLIRSSKLIMIIKMRALNTKKWLTWIKCSSDRPRCHYHLRGCSTARSWKRCENGPWRLKSARMPPATNLSFRFRRTPASEIMACSSKVLKRRRHLRKKLALMKAMTECKKKASNNGCDQFWNDTSRLTD